MQAAEQQVYLELVQELLNCSQGQESELLATKPELVNEQLVEALLLVAERREQDVAWLRGFSQNLATQLGLERGGVEKEKQPDSEDWSQADLDFLFALMKAEQNDSSQVQQLFAQNIERLTPQLGAIMKWSMAQILERELENADDSAALIENIAIKLSDFQLGNRAQNIEIVIAGYAAVLTAWTKENSPEYWARAQCNLGNAYQNRSRGDKAENLEQSIDCYQSALEIYTKADFHTNWATTQNNLAMAYCNRIRGDKAKNLEQSIAYYTSVLEIRTKADFPLAWAQTQINLADVYNMRIRGNKAENLEQSIAHYTSALEIRTKADLPLAWAQTQNDLANAYHDRIRGDKAENIEQSIACHNSAMEIYTKADFPIDWATIQNNIANAYRDRIREDKAKNLERSITGYQSALEIRTKADLPLAWAQTQNDLANAYRDRIRGDKAENTEQSIACHNFAIEIYTKADFPMDWAGIQNNLAVAYSKRIRGNRAENIEQSITGYQSALEIYTKADFPMNWAMTQNNLAAAYSERIRGDKAENLELSIACYQSALEIRTKKDFPIDWATTQHNLGFAYSERIRGDRGENLEQSIACDQSALEIRTKKDFPIDWAMTQNNLAIAYSYRIRGDRGENLEQSIAYYDAALEIRTKKDFPIDWATTQNNLAVAYSKRIRGEEAENLEQSIACDQSALEIRTKKDFPIDWAQTQNNLGFAYSYRIRGDRGENLEQSIAYYDAALEIRTKADFPIDWALTQNNLAVAYRKRIRGEKAENLKQSIACYQSALEIFAPQNFPIECLQTAENLGNLHFNAGNWQAAIDPYILAITAVEQSRSWATSEQSKQEIIAQAIEVYFNLVQCCINTQQYAKALEYAERSKSRNLVELLATRDLYPKGDIPPDILSQLDTLRRQVQAEERRLSQRSDSGGSDSRSIASVNSPHSDSDREQLINLRQDLDLLIREQIQSIDPSFQLTQQVQSIDFATMQGTLPNHQTALIAWYVIHNRINTFLVTPHQNQPLVISSTAAESADLDTLCDTYLVNYRTDKDTWSDNLPQLLDRISQLLKLPEIITLLQQLVPDCNQLILVPHRILHLLPLHALPLNPAGDCLLDLFSQGVRYAPSIQLLNLAQTWQRPPLQRLFAVQNPTSDLKFTDVEVSTIRQQFDPHVEVLKRDKADKSALNAASLGDANCAHFSCHGSFNFEHPLASALILSGGIITTPSTPTAEKSSHYLPYRNGGSIDLDNCLTLGEIFQLDLHQCRLVTLSACETGLTDANSLGDEYVGLPSGFLYAGSANVVSSLWAVSDLSTTLLMIKFYQNLKETESVSIALNQAQQWLRQVTKLELLDWISHLTLRSSEKFLVDSWTEKLDLVNDNTRIFNSPYHWAAFCSIG
jgi:CHAT domain-containing protein/tetratricopeptide (TPR) repeat protein